MYYLVVVAFVVVLPLLSIGYDISNGEATFGAAVIGKWFVYWAMGWRLLSAGVRQIAQPEYTAREILGLKGDESRVLVRELGFANVALGLLGVLSLYLPPALLVAALVGGVYYALAGLNHVRRAHRNRLESFAMVSDLFVAAVLLAFCAVTV